MIRAGGLLKMRGNALLAAFALLAFSVRALVPAGMMLAAEPASAALISIKLCTSQGEVDAKIDKVTGRIVHGDEDRTPAEPGGDHAPCAFAAAPAALALPTVASLIRRPPPVANTAWTSTVDIAPGRGLAAPPPWATGPPTLV
jgi:hypothetical protein